MNKSTKKYKVSEFDIYMDIVSYILSSHTCELYCNHITDHPFTNSNR